MTTQTLVSPAKQFLAQVIRADALYCAAGGVGALVLAGPISRWLGLTGTGYVLGLGVVLLLYAAELFWLTRAGQASTALGWATVVMNMLWIDGTILLLLTDWLPLEPAGRWLLILVGAGVAIFGLAQAYATWQLRGESR